MYSNEKSLDNRDLKKNTGKKPYVCVLITDPRNSIVRGPKSSVSRTKPKFSPEIF